MYSEHWTQTRFVPYVVYPGRAPSPPPPPPRKIIRSLIVSTGEAASPVSSYVLTYGEIRYLNENGYISYFTASKFGNVQVHALQNAYGCWNRSGASGTYHASACFLEVTSGHFLLL